MVGQTYDDKQSILQDERRLPKSMADALEWEDPVEALRSLATASDAQALKQAKELEAELETLRVTLPEILTKIDSDHPVTAAAACADSILNSLTKVASGGSQASQEIRQLEEEKRDLDAHADAIAMALSLRQNSDRAAHAIQARHWKAAAEAIRPWLDWSKEDDPDPRCRAYAGEYTLQQLSNSHAQLKEVLLSQYEEAVRKGDLQALGQMTPVLSILQLEQDAVRLYLQFLKNILDSSMKHALEKPPPKGQKASPPFVPMAHVYNASVACIRHHLPMVSHCLYKADGDAAVVQLVHVQTEETVLPLIQKYQQNRQLATVSRNAAHVYAALEERYTGRSLVDTSDNDEDDDCGFAVSLGSLSDVNASMDEAALCIQHTESYLRFMIHTCEEVNKARKIRHDQAQRQALIERERQEWASGKTRSNEEEDNEYEPLQILPPFTPLHEAVAELGGQYASIERCLLLASMRRAFVLSESNPRYYRPLSIGGVGADSSKALQTSVVETCMFAAKRGTQRAFATGHTGTASAMTNFCVDCLTDILLDVLSSRAEESGVARLKPGEGLLVGSANLFNNASNLIRQGTHVGSAVAGHTAEELAKKQKMQELIAHACATINDLEVVVVHVEQIEKLLIEAIDRGFPPDHHDTEQLKMCVKAMGPVAESFRVAANSTIESLESVLAQRLRSIVGEVIGAEGSSSTTFMTSSVIGGGKSHDGVKLRVNYNLDEEGYQMQQLAESYMARLCMLLDELLQPLRMFLAPRLWDTLLLHVLGTVSKRLETSLRKCQFTALGALALDSDMRDFLSFAKERLYSPDYASNIAVAKACPHLSRLLQITKLLNVDDLDDVLDLISASKRKGNWDLKLEETKTFLSSRVEFEGSKVNELLRLPDDD